MDTGKLPHSRGEMFRSLRLPWRPEGQSTLCLLPGPQALASTPPQHVMCHSRERHGRAGLPEAAVYPLRDNISQEEVGTLHEIKEIKFEWI